MRSALVLQKKTLRKKGIFLFNNVHLENSVKIYWFVHFGDLDVNFELYETILENVFTNNQLSINNQYLLFFIDLPNQRISRLVIWKTN